MGILDNLPHTATAKRRTRSQGSMGGGKDTFTTLFSDRPCWRQPIDGVELMEFNRRGIEVTHKIYFVTDPDLDERDVVIMGTEEMEVKAGPKPDTTVGLGIAYKVMVELHAKP